MQVETAGSAAGEGLARIVIPADPMAVRDGLQALFDTLLLRSLHDDARGTAEVVLAEALNNIVEHAYACAGGEIELTLRLNGADLTCRITDSGRPMPGHRLPEGRPAPPECLAEGGYGWHLIRSLSRDLAYDRVEGRNRLSFRLETGQTALI